MTAEATRYLISRGVRILGPVRGRLASGHEGAGRMVEADVIVAAVEETLGTIARD